MVPVPSYVYRRGFENIYHGRRLLVARGIKSGGHITARFETETYCFRNSIHGIRFEGLEPWQEAVITAVFWSSLARYYYFATSGSWGLWHDEIHLDHVKEMPVPFPKESELRERIVRIVNELQNLSLTREVSLLDWTDSDHQDMEIRQELDAAIYDLYELNSAERDLVHEMCSVGLDLFYRNQESEAVAEVTRPDRDIGTLADVTLADVAPSTGGLSAYIRTFLECWKPVLDADIDLVWQVISPPSGAPLLAVAFTIQDNNGIPVIAEVKEDWSDVLARLEHSSKTSSGSSRIMVDTFFRYVGDQEFLFVKRNEQRFWTLTAAREDAESVMTFLMNRKNKS